MRGRTAPLQFGVLNFDAASETCSVQRSFVAGSFQQVPGPLITVKAGNQHPWNRTVFSGAFVRFSLDLSPSGSTADLDWYWAIVYELTVYWVTPAGLSLTPAPFSHGPAVTLNNQTLFVFGLGNSMIKTAFFAVNGSDIVAIDHMTAITLPSP